MPQPSLLNFCVPLLHNTETVRKKEYEKKKTLLLCFLSQGSFSEQFGCLVHCINMAVLITFPAAVVLLLPSVTPGRVVFH